MVIELQDDTGLQAQAAFPFSDGKGLAYALIEIPIIATLEQYLAVDLAPLRQVAVDWEGDIAWATATWKGLARPDPTRDAALRAQLRILQHELAAVWQPPDTLRQAIERLLRVLDLLDPSALSAICQAVSAHPSQQPFVTSYLGGRGLSDDLRAVLLMLAWADLRGAARVRLVAR